MTNETARVIPFERLRMTDLAQVGGKNASLGEMISQLAGAGIRVPGGFATTAFAFREFLGHENLAHRIARAPGRARRRRRDRAGGGRRGDPPLAFRGAVAAGAGTGHSRCLSRR